jgi:uncharacterized protein (DUF952 family)
VAEAPPRLTFHLTTRAWWEASDPSGPLRAPSLETEGFIHCTDGTDEMVATANRHYGEATSDFVILTVDLDRVSSRWTVEDARAIYPHIFGPIDRPAILRVMPAPRADDGAFLAFED